MPTTASPVPLPMTFRDMDLLVADAQSRAVRRAALDAFVQGRDRVHHFLS